MPTTQASRSNPTKAPFAPSTGGGIVACEPAVEHAPAKMMFAWDAGGPPGASSPAASRGRGGRRYRNEGHE